MAEMLRDSDSSVKHLSIARRHIRLYTLQSGAEFLVANMQSSYTQLQTTFTAKRAAQEAEEDARDDLEFRGRDAADTLRTISERAKQHDREHPGDNAFAHVFPEGGFSEYITSQGTVSASNCGVIAKRIAELGANHPMMAFAGDLNARVTAIDEGQTNYDTALRARKMAEADDELAQAALRRAYEHNALDAQKKFGKRADRLFPRIRKTSRRDEDGGEDT
jgi:hypothetical protein